MARDDDAVRRRTFLATVGMGVLAGCTTDSEEPTTDPPSTTSQTEAPTDSRTVTDTATATATPDDGTPQPRPLDGSWSSYGYDLGNTGLNPDTGPATGTAITWSKAVEGDNTLPEPVITEAAVFICSESTVYAIDRESGTPLWDTDVGAPTYFYTPAVDDERVYAVGRGLSGAFRGNDRAGVLAALDAHSGSTIWSRDAFVNSSPVLSDGVLYHAATTADRGSIEAVGAADGATRWSYEFGGDGEKSTSFGTPALGGGSLYATGSVGTEDAAVGRVVALDPADGQRQWAVSTDAPVELSPVYGDGHVYVAEESGHLRKITTDTQSTVWTHAFDEPPVSKPSVGNGLVYALVDDVLTVLDDASGDVQWTREIGPVQSTITVTPDVVYVGGTELDAFDATTGERLWALPIDGYAGAYGVPVAVDEYLYVGACVKATEGSLYDNYVYQLG